MQRNAAIIEQLRVYTNRQIPLLWGSVLAAFVATHLVAAYLIEQLWGEHYAVNPWVGVAAALVGLAFLLYEKVGHRLQAAEFELKRTAMGFWDYERGYQHCDSIRRAADVGFLGAVLIYAAFLLGQMAAAADCKDCRVWVDLAPGAQLQLLATPQQGSLLIAGAALIIGALAWIHRVKTQIRSDLGA